MLNLSEGTLSYQQELLQRIRALNDEILKTEKLTKLEIRDLNSIQMEQENIQKSKCGEFQTLKEMENALDAKKQRTKTLNQTISQINAIKKDKMAEINRNKKEISNVEKAMNDRHETQVNSLLNFGNALSSINDRLHYENILSLFEAKSPQCILKEIETATMRALKTMGCPQNMAIKQFNANKMKFKYPNSEKAEQGSDSSEAMAVDQKDGDLKQLKEENEALLIEIKKHKEKHGKLEKEANEKKEKLQEMESKNKTIGSNIEKGRKEIETDLDWIKKKFLSNLEKFLRKLDELSQNDPKFGDNAINPFCEQEFKISQLKNAAQIFQTKYDRVKDTANTLYLDIFLKEIQAKQQQQQ